MSTASVMLMNSSFRSIAASVAFLGMADRPHALTASELPTLRQKLQVVIEGIDSYLCEGGQEGSDQ